MRFARSWAVLALVSLLGTLGLVSGQALYVCAGDGVARTACCCPEHSEGDGAQAAMSSRCCCAIDRLATATLRSEPARKASATESSRPDALADLPPHVLGAENPRAGAVSGGIGLDSATLPAPIPILLRKQSFLI